MGPTRRSCFRARLALAALLVTAAVAVNPTGAASAPSPVAVSISAPSTVVTGDQLTYTIVVRNTGGASITEVVMSDTVNGLSGSFDGNQQTNVLALSSTVGTCDQTGNTVRCELGTLAGRQSATITIRGTVVASAGTSLTNTATATATKSATTFTASATATTSVTGSSGGGGTQPDLAVTVKAPVATPPSSDIVYTLTVNNLGGVKASNVVVRASLDPDLDYVTYTATNLFVCTPGTDPDTLQPILTCSGGAVNAGASATIQIGVTAPAFDTTVVVTAAADPENTIVESDELNNFGEATTQVSLLPANPPGMFISKTDGPDPLAPGEQLEYTVFVENDTPDRADYLEVVDGTQGLDPASVSVSWTYGGTPAKNPPALTCTVSAPKVTCTTTRFQPGQTATITIRGTVVAPAGTSILNTATVNANILNTGFTNTASTITTVKPARDLSVTQQRTFPASPVPVRAGDQFRYEITVGNSGLYDANNVLVRQPLPTGTIPGLGKDDVLLDTSLGAGPGWDAAPGTTCSVSTTNVLSCVIASLAGEATSQPGGATTTITLYLIAPHATGPISSTVTVDPNNAISEHDEANNSFTTTEQVQTGIDLEVTKADSPDPVARNGTLRYTITVTNLGTQDSTGIVVRDVLPTGTVFRSAIDVASPNGGPDGGSVDQLHNFTCTPTGNVVECVGGRIEGTWSGHKLEDVDTAKIQIDVFAPDEPGEYFNEVRVDPLNLIPEKDETNNLFVEDTQVINVNGDPATYGQYKELRVDDIVETSPDTPNPPNKPYATSGLLDYDITVVNNGLAPIAATDDVVVRITLPVGSIFRDAYDLAIVPPTSSPAGAFTCTHLGGRIVECRGGAFDPTDTRGIRVETFAPPTPGTAHLQAMVDPDNAIGESDETNNVNDEVTQIAAGEITEVQGTYIDLRPDITGDASVATSGNLDHQVKISNPGVADAFDVTFRVVLPQGATFRSADDAAPGEVDEAFTCTQSAGVVTCTGGRVHHGGNRVVNIKSFAPAQPISNARTQVIVDPANAIPEGHEGNNADEHLTSVQVNGPDEFIDLTVAKATEIPPGSDAPGGAIKEGRAYSYLLTVTNGGSDDAFNVVVRDPLPAGVTFVSAHAVDIASNFVCSQSGGVVSCTGGWVRVEDPNNPGSGLDVDGAPIEREIRIEVLAPRQHGRIVLNQAFVDPDNAIAEGSEVNNGAQVSNTVNSTVDLDPDMSNGTAGPAAEGDWAFSVENKGTDIARNVLVVANFSSGTIHLNTAASGWSCEVFENPVNQVRCVGDIEPGAANKADFSVRYFKTADETINSYVIVDPNDTIVEIAETNNRADATG